MTRSRRPRTGAPWRDGWRRWLAWEWSPTRWLHLRLDLTMLNLPRIMVDESRPRRWWSLSWGNGNSDPVWGIDVELGRDDL